MRSFLDYFAVAIMFIALGGLMWYIVTMSLEEFLMLCASVVLAVLLIWAALRIENM